LYAGVDERRIAEIKKTKYPLFFLFCFLKINQKTIVLGAVSLYMTKFNLAKSQVKFSLAG